MYTMRTAVYQVLQGDRVYRDGAYFPVLEIRYVAHVMQYELRIGPDEWLAYDDSEYVDIAY